MSTQFQVENVADSDIDNSKKTLVASLELALVKYLDSDDGGILDGAAEIRDEKAYSGSIPPPTESTTDMSKLSFQYGFKVFFMTLVVCVCSASTVMTAKGSGRRKTSRFDNPSAATTIAPSVSAWTSDGAVSNKTYPLS